MNKRTIKIAASLFAIVSIMSACGADKEVKEKATLSKVELKKSIQMMEDSLKGLQKNQVAIGNLHRQELLNRFDAYQLSYPNDEYSAICLDNMHMIYAGMGIYDRSVSYADSCLERFPNYKNKEMILESQGSNYDIFITPRDSAKVRTYYTRLLKESKSMPKDKRQGIEERLMHNHLSFDDFVNLKIKDIALK